MEDATAHAGVTSRAVDVPADAVEIGAGRTMSSSRNYEASRLPLVDGFARSTSHDDL
jgi:hypothetical protein